MRMILLGLMLVSCGPETYARSGLTIEECQSWCSSKKDMVLSWDMRWHDYIRNQDSATARMVEAIGVKPKHIPKNDGTCACVVPYDLR